MSKYRIENLPAILITIISVILLIGTLIGFIIKKQDVLVKETDEYLYYKEYKIYNLDSCVYKYHKPIIYDGIITNKYKSHGFVGVVGKGGHSVTYYHIIVTYNGKNYEEKSSDIYNMFEKGEKVKVVEKFYPHYRLNIIKIN